MLEKYGDITGASTPVRSALEATPVEAPCLPTESNTPTPSEYR